ncbi:hypothetical protein [Acinetobacter lactucae]|uniref:hypothetical protein n=1 Tax=Acinetobacter lactucae TaxID=1785128 RepID=UPI00217537BC|nr:hypothetical protein [Acinetobacter lactucae]
MTDLNNPETIEIHGLRTITKLCHFGADNNMEGCTFTEIVERLFAELEKAKAQAVPDTHVLVEKSKIEIWWQDAEEPENFASCIEDMPSLGHYLTGDEIMEITEHHTIHLPSKTTYGVWVNKDGDRSFCTGTLEECQALVASESGAEG